MPKKSKTTKKPKREPKITPQDEVLEDCKVMLSIAANVGGYINTKVEDDQLKAYLLGRMTALQSNIEVIGDALADPEKALKDFIEDNGFQPVNDIFEEIFTRLGNIEIGLVTVGIGTFCEDCEKYAPPVERVDETPDPICFIPPKKKK